MTRNIVGVVAASMLTMATSPAAAQTVHQLDLPAGSLQQAVIALGQQTGVSIAVANPDLTRIRVRRVHGRMTVEQALRRMLTGTRATHVVLDGANYRIIRAPVRKPAPQSPAAVPRPAAPDPAMAQTDIVVTGSKRQLRLRYYPGPATVISGDQLEAGAGTEAISERIPSLGSTHLGPGRDKLFIRAIADSSFSGQTQATVGQYLGDARLNYNAPDPNLRLYDIATVELLAGPQGALYGAGSMGGVLQIVPNAPDPSGRSATVIGSAAFTRHGDISRELAGVVNLPIVDGSSAIRLVGYDLVDGGYIDDVGRGRNDVNRTTIRGGRLSGLLQLGSEWRIEGGGLIQSIEGDDGQYADRSLPGLARSGMFAQPFSSDYSLAYVTLHGSLGQTRLTSTMSAADQHLAEQLELKQEGRKPFLFRQRNWLSLLSAETRLSRTNEDGTGWLLGAQFLDNGLRVRRSSGLPGEFAPLLGVSNSIDEQTIFGEVTQRISSAVALTGGGRITHVHYSGKAVGSAEVPIGGSNNAGDSEWRFLPALAASVDIGRDSLLYLRYQESFRPGGVIIHSNAAEELKSDHIAAWEAGMRFGQRPSARLGGAIAISYGRWTDVQADTVDTLGLPATANIGDGKVYTLEANLDWRPIRDLRFNAAGTFNRSRVTSAGPGIIVVYNDPLPNVPRFVARAGIEYAVPVPRLGELRLFGWGRYVGKSQLGFGPILGRSQGDYLDVGAEARIGPVHRFLFLRGTNLLDKVGNRFALGSILTIVNEDQITPLRPRTIRLGLQASF